MDEDRTKKTKRKGGKKNRERKDGRTRVVVSSQPVHPRMERNLASPDLLGLLWFERSLRVWIWRVSDDGGRTDLDDVYGDVEGSGQGEDLSNGTRNA